mmetsp:Transcript_57853/g.136316  ORF Transcript_57853/g.136316 Transcript_57853/m.136316 type:complete len:203 (-) Transcript_57853:13-621(-)
MLGAALTTTTPRAAVTAVMATASPQRKPTSTWDPSTHAINVPSATVSRTPPPRSCTNFMTCGRAPPSADVPWPATRRPSPSSSTPHSSATAPSCGTNTNRVRPSCMFWSTPLSGACRPADVAPAQTASTTAQTRTQVPVTLTTTPPGCLWTSWRRTPPPTPSPWTSPTPRATSSACATHGRATAALRTPPPRTRVPSRRAPS